VELIAAAGRSHQLCVLVLRTIGGEKITVTKKEFQTMEFMTKNARPMISRGELLNEVWGYQIYLVLEPWTTISSSYDRNWRETLPTHRTFSQYLV
jgi:DNA-binding response OmpR family regulator